MNSETEKIEQSLDYSVSSELNKTNKKNTPPSPKTAFTETKLTKCLVFYFCFFFLHSRDKNISTRLPVQRQINTNFFTGTLEATNRIIGLKITLPSK